MEKIIVGIIPKIQKDDIDPYKNKNEFVNMYSNKIYELNQIPIGILLENGHLNKDVIDICDCFILQGGIKADKHYYEIIEYAVNSNKPLLGICLGMQAIGIYSLIIDRLNSNNDMDMVYKKLKEENGGSVLSYLDPPNGHGDYIVSFSNDSIIKARHDIIINENSILYDIYKEKHISIVSLHNYVLTKIGNMFEISARDKDGVIEAIEYKDKNKFIVGVQYHPEIEDNNMLFKRLIDEAKKRK